MSARGSTSVSPIPSSSSSPIPPLGVYPGKRSSAAYAAASSATPSARSSGPTLKLPSITPRNAEEAAELDAEKAAKAAAKKHKVALTPAEKRALKLRHEQAKEEAEAQKKLKAKILEQKRQARRNSTTASDSNTARGSGEQSLSASGAASGRASTEGLAIAVDGELAHGHLQTPGNGGEIEFVENDDGSMSAIPARRTPSQYEREQEEQDEEQAALEAEAETAKAEENYDILFDGPKSALVMASAARQLHEMMRLIQEVPIEYRVEFVNAYDDHGCSAIFFAIGPEHGDAMQILLDYGADPNHQNNKKNGPLHIACAIQNKRSAKILIEHGANIMLENWQYQKPHEMVTERDKVSSTQAYLNQCVENFQEKVANKEVFANVPRHCRSYYRSIYDIIDEKELGVLKYDMVEHLLNNMPVGADGFSTGTITPQDPKLVFGFFKGWDFDKNGVISFGEFLHKILLALAEKEKIKKKLKRRQLMAAKRKKKKEAEAAKKAMPTAKQIEEQKAAAAAAAAAE